MNQLTADKFIDNVRNCDVSFETGQMFMLIQLINSFVSEDEPLTINLDGRVCPPGTVSPKHKLHIKTKLETDTEIAKRLWKEYGAAVYWREYEGHFLDFPDWLDQQEEWMCSECDNTEKPKMPYHTHGCGQQENE